MDIERLMLSPAGDLVRISGTDARTRRSFDYHAFVPRPLPDQPDLAPATWNAVYEAGQALAGLKQVCLDLPNPQLLIAPALAKEAQATSALEGTYGALPDVLEARLPGFAPRSPEIREINAYDEMARLAFEDVRDRPITTGMLVELQGVLARGSRRPVRDPGMIRDHQVIIGPENCEIVDARFVPPPPGDQLRAGLSHWERWLRDEHELPSVVRAALAHYQFETLHPFGDGNGRVGRLVIVMQFLIDGEIDEPSLTISPWLLRRRDRYQDLLFETSCTGDWNPWVQFFALGVKEQALTHVTIANELRNWIADTRAELNERHWSGTIATVAEALIDWPVVTNAVLKKRLSVSAPTAQNAIDRLVTIGVLHELTGRSYGRVYGARRVMEIVEGL